MAGIVYARYLVLKKHGAAWTENERHLLRNCWDRGMEIPQIADQLKRSERAVCMQLVNLGVCFDEEQALLESDERQRRKQI